MVWFMIAIGIFSIIAFIIIISKIYVSFSYTYENKTHSIKITVRFYGLKLFSNEWQLNKYVFNELLEKWLEEENDKEFKLLLSTLKTAKENFRKIPKLFRQSVQILQFYKLDWKTSVGTGNASSTGIVTGHLWMLKGTAIGILHELASIHIQPKLEIQPHFQQKLFQSNLDCIVSFRIGKAIYMLIKMFINMFPMRKEAYI